MKRIFILGLVPLLVFSCKKEVNPSKPFKGATVQVHGGKAWTTYLEENNGRPGQLSISIENAVLENLPGGGGGNGHDHSENSFVLPLHPKAIEATPFKTVGMDWAPEGHPPANVYTVPHFDFHFYMISAAELAAATDPVKLNTDPDPAYLPMHYVGANPIPQMGKHWIDVTSPELNPTNPAPFTQTFIYGSYDGKVNFYEPMITLDFLKNTNSFQRTIPQPQKFKQSGYYPTSIQVEKQSNITEIILSGFTYRTAS